MFMYIDNKIIESKERIDIEVKFSIRAFILFVTMCDTW